MNREERRQMEREERRRRKMAGRQDEAKEEGASEGDAWDSLEKMMRSATQKRPGQDAGLQDTPGGGRRKVQLAPPPIDADLRIMQRKDESRRKQELSLSRDPLSQQDDYRYFHYDEILASMGVTEEDKRKAAKIKPYLKNERFSQGYYERGEQMELIGQIEAELSEKKRSFFSVPVTALISFNGHRVLQGRCTNWECGERAYFDGQGRRKACEHCIALLLMFENYFKKENPGDATDRQGKFLLDDVRLNPRELTAKAAQEGEDAGAADGKVLAEKNVRVLDMEPYIREEYDGGLIAHFRVGESRLYKIRNLDNFLHSMEKQESVRFGTKTVLYLSEERLTERGERWFHFLQSCSREEQERMQALRRNRVYYNGELGDSVPLVGGTLDTLLQLLPEGEGIEYAKSGQNGIRKEILHKSPDSIKLSFLIAPVYENEGGKGARGAFQGVMLSAQLPVLYEGREAYSIDLGKKSIYKIEPKLAKILRTMQTEEVKQGNQYTARIGRKRLSEFYHKTLPRLQEIAEVTEILSEEIEPYIAPLPSFVFYFDYKDGTILAHTSVLYGSHIHDVADFIPIEGRKQPTIAEYRDLEAENGVLDLFFKYVPMYDPEKHFFFIDSEDQLFHLLSAGIPHLMSIGEVQGTDAFRRLGIRKQVKLQAGVSLDSGIMNLEIQSEDLSEEELLGLFEQYRLKRKYFRMRSGDFLNLTDEGMQDLMERLESMMDALHMTPQQFVKGKMHIPAYRALYINRMLEDSEAIMAEKNSRFKRLIQEFRAVEDADFDVPKSLRRVLRKYQVAGYRWVRTLDRYGFGGILADEMGLGKTLQIIAMLLAEAQERGNAAENLSEQEAGGLAKEDRMPPAARLVHGDESAVIPVNAVVPFEAGGENGNLPERGVGGLPQGSGQEAGKTSLVVCPAALVYNWGEEFRRFAPSLRVCLVVGTQTERAQKIASFQSFDVLVTSYDLLKRDIAEYEGKLFRFQVIDEAQFIKNHSTAAAKAVKLIQARSKFALTGTPIENRLSELWSIFDYLMQGFLYGYQVFRKEYELPIVKNQDELVTGRLRQMVGSFILRRRKQDVLRDLPEKLEEIRTIGMDEKQMKIYDAQVAHMREMLRAQDEDSYRRNKLQVLAELTRIRQICCDPHLCYENYNGQSAKLEACMELVQSIVDGEHKALLFSQFTSMLAIIEERLRQAGIAYYKITGSTEKSKRIQLVNAFNADSTPIFLISLKAGGTGLNLTGADIVIHYDPWWNIAIENQATDRAHRIGQTKVVTVYKLIIQNTLEEKILEMQEHKLKLAEDILDSDSIASTVIEKEELLKLLG